MASKQNRAFSCFQGVLSSDVAVGHLRLRGFITGEWEVGREGAQTQCMPSTREAGDHRLSSEGL